MNTVGGRVKNRASSGRPSFRFVRNNLNHNWEYCNNILHWFVCPRRSNLYLPPPPPRDEVGTKQLVMSDRLNAGWTSKLDNDLSRYKITNLYNKVSHNLWYSYLTLTSSNREWPLLRPRSSCLLVFSPRTRCARSHAWKLIFHEVTRLQTLKYVPNWNIYKKDSPTTAR